MAAADLQLGLGRAEVAFGLVVGERHRQVAGEQQDLVVAVAQAFEQVAGLGLAPGDAAVFGEPDQQRVAPRVEQRVGDLGRDRRWLLVTGVVGGGVEPVQGAQRLLGPDPGRGGPRQRRSARGPGAPRTGHAGRGVGVVDAQGVVHHGSAERGQHLELGHRGPSAGGCR